jgi:peroxiredoxin
VRWRADDYHAQGERLKPLEKTIKALLGQPDPIAPNARSQKRPRVGETAPDFAVGNGQRLSDLRGKTVLVTFYPAAFSGIIPTANPITSEGAKAVLEAKQTRMMMCSFQLTSLDNPSNAPTHETDPSIVKLAISSAQPTLLSEWRTLLNTHDIDYISDIDYSISQQYGSYDAKHGYNQRTVFIIDKAGKIAFVDDEYTSDDADTVQEALKTISMQP